LKIIRFLFIAFLLTCLQSSTLLPVQAQTVEEITAEILVVFNEISEAEASGAEVSQLVVELNQIILLVNRGTETDLNEANTRLGQLSEAALDATVTGSRTTQNELISTVIIGVTSIITSILAWIYTPRIFWALWLRVKGDWTVEK